MKNLTLTLLFAVFSIFCGHAQYIFVEDPDYSREEAISILKENYVFMYLRHPADTVATLDRFVETLNRIVPIGDGKREAIKAQALAAVQKQTIFGGDMRTERMNAQTEKLPSIDWQIQILVIGTPNLENYIPLLAGNVDAVIRANFNDADYAMIYKTLYDERNKARGAYRVLGDYFRSEAPEKIEGIGAARETYAEVRFNKIFDHYNIR